MTAVLLHLIIIAALLVLIWSYNRKLIFFLASPNSEVQDSVYLGVMFMTNFDNFNVSRYQLTSEFFPNDTASASWMCVGSNIRIAGKSDIDSSELFDSSEFFLSIVNNEFKKHSNVL